MAVTYDSIASTTLTASSATITFSSISGSYTDLRLVVSVVAGASSAGTIQLNGVTAASYSYTTIYGTGATATSARGTGTSDIQLSSGGFSTSNVVLYTVDLFSYAGSTFKSVLITASEDKNGSGYVERTVAMLRSTSAITSIDIKTAANGWGIGTTASLYGITKA